MRLILYYSSLSSNTKVIAHNIPGDSYGSKLNKMDSACLAEWETELKFSSRLQRNKFQVLVFRDTEEQV